MPSKYSKKLRRAGATVALAIATTAVFAGPAHANLLWTANAELPWDQEWANYSCQDVSRVQEVSAPDPVAQGQHAYRIEVRDGDNAYGERCELGQGNPTRDGFPLFHPGDDRWISFQVYLPNDYPIDTDTWNNFMQLKQLGDLGTPAISMEVEQHQFIFMNSDTNHDSSGKNWWWEGPATQNRWVKFTLHVKFSSDPNVGFVELYGDLDGQGMKQLMPRTSMWTMKVDSTGKTVDSQSRIGLYRDSAIQGTSHIYFDGYSVGDDRASTEAAAFEGTGSTATVAPPTGSTTTTTTTTGDQTSTGTTTTTKGKKHKSRILLSSPTRYVTAAGSHRRVRLPLHGRVRPAGGAAHATVILQVRRHGRWRWLSRGSVGANGRFHMTPTLKSRRARVVKLRAVVSGLGRSNVVRARVP